MIALVGLLPLAAQAAPIDVLFVGNSYTFGRVDPVMSYNAANVTDLTSPARGGIWADTSGTNPFEPHPWGGVAGIFKQLTDQAGLDYNVSLSTRNAASLRGHFLNTAPSDWDLRSNISLQTWDKVVLQEQSDEVLPRNTNIFGNDLASNPEFTQGFVNVIENYLHEGTTGEFRMADWFEGATHTDRVTSCNELTGVSRGSCSLTRTYTNPNGSEDTEVYVYQTWARQNLIDGAHVTTTDDVTGDVTRSADLSENTHYDSLEAMTADLVAGYQQTAAAASADGTGGLAGIAPVGEAFLRAVQSGVATRDMWADDALTDGLIDLWFDDGTHASTYGSYLSSLVLFGTLTGLDPASFGRNEIAAMDLGVDARSALLLQRIASDQLGFAPGSAVPLPATGPMAAAALAMLGLIARRRRRRGRQGAARA